MQRGVLLGALVGDSCDAVSFVNGLESVIP